MDSGEWIPMDLKRPAGKDWDEQGKILIWDKNNGCMIGKVQRYRDMIRQPITHWRHIPCEWIPMAMFKPSATDADLWGCILAFDRDDGAFVIGWNNPTIKQRNIIGWQKLPEGPKNISTPQWLGSTAKSIT